MTDPVPLDGRVALLTCPGPPDGREPAVTIDKSRKFWKGTDAADFDEFVHGP